MATAVHVIIEFRLRRGGAITILGSLVVETEGDEIPDWEVFRPTIFPIRSDETLERIQPDFRLKGLSDSLRSKKPRLAADTYKVWVVGADHDSNATVSEDHDEA